MLTHIRWGMTLASVMLFYSTQAVAQFVPSAPSTAPTASQLQNVSDGSSEAQPSGSQTPEAQPSETQTSRTQTSEAQSFPQDPVPVCPAGQFASAFPDVTPNDWAYEAVNRLAIGPMRCFPDPSQS